MKAKKCNKADLESKRVIFLQIGFVLALSFVLLAFNHKSYERTSRLDIRVQVDDTPEDFVPITQHDLKPPPPPPPKQLTIINIMDDGDDIEDIINIDVEAGQFTEIADFIPVIDDEEDFDEMQIFPIVESMPEFPGGDAALMKFLKGNINYPQLARESGIQGTVFVTFVVEVDGSVTDVRILRGIGGGCDEEAIRVIRKIPNWIPGLQRGKPVRVQFTVPISFILQG